MILEEKKSNAIIILKILSIALTAIPIYFVILLVITNMVNVPFWDQWNWVPLVGKFFSGSITFNDIWEPYFEHRIVIQKLVMLAFAYVTHWDVRYELLVNVISEFFIFCVLIKIIKDNFGLFSKVYLLLLPTIALIVFSPTQYENWILGGDMGIVLCTALISFGIYKLTEEPHSTMNFIIGVFIGVIASLTFGTGLAYWFVGAWIITQWKKSRNTICKLLLLWLMASSVIYYLYFNSVFVTRTNFIQNIILNPVPLVEYILIYIGRPITSMTLSHTDLMIMGGIFGLISFISSVIIVWKYVPKQRMFIIPFIAFGLFTIINALFTGINRVHFGILQAGASRYTTVSNLFWVSILVLFVYIHHYIFQNRMKFNKKQVFIMNVSILSLFTCVLVFLLASGWRSSHEFQSFHNRFLSGQAKLLSGDVCVKELFIHGYPPCDEEKINILKQYQLSTFSN